MDSEAYLVSPGHREVLVRAQNLNPNPEKSILSSEYLRVLNEFLLLPEHPISNLKHMDKRNNDKVYL